MKIVQFIHSLDIGGAEIHTLELCKGLVALGHELIVVGPEGSLRLEFEKVGVRVVIDCPKLYPIDTGFISRQVGFLKHEKPDVVHCHELRLSIHGLLASFKSRVPVRVVNIHTPLPNWHIPIYKKVPNLILNFFLVNLLATDVIALTHATRNIRVWGEFILPWKIRIIPNGIDLKKFTPSGTNKKDSHQTLCKKLNVHSQTFLVGTLSRLTVEKGVETGLKGFMQFLDSVSVPDDFHLIIAGDGILRVELEKLVQVESKSKWITFLGEIEESFKPNYLWGLDLFLFPTHHEGFGLVLTEAMLARTLTLSSNLSVLKELTDQGKFGYHFKKDNPTDLAKALRKITDSTHNDEQLLKKAQAHVVNNYSLEKFVKSYDQLYKDSLGRNS